MLTASPHGRGRESSLVSFLVRTQSRSDQGSTLWTLSFNLTYFLNPNASLWKLQLQQMHFGGHSSILSKCELVVFHTDRSRYRNKSSYTCMFVCINAYMYTYTQEHTQTHILQLCLLSGPRSSDIPKGLCPFST